MPLQNEGNAEKMALHKGEPRKETKIWLESRTSIFQFSKVKKLTHFPSSLIQTKIEDGIDIVQIKKL